jgi:hypothetical protein
MIKKSSTIDKLKIGLTPKRAHITAYRFIEFVTRPYGIYLPV